MPSQRQGDITILIATARAGDYSQVKDNVDRVRRAMEPLSSDINIVEARRLETIQQRLDGQRETGAPLLIITEPRLNEPNATNVLEAIGAYWREHAEDVLVLNLADAHLPLFDPPIEPAHVVTDLSDESLTHVRAWVHRFLTYYSGLKEYSEYARRLGWNERRYLSPFIPWPEKPEPGDFEEDDLPRRLAPGAALDRFNGLAGEMERAARAECDEAIKASPDGPDCASDQLQLTQALFHLAVRARLDGLRARSNYQSFQAAASALRLDSESDIRPEAITQLFVPPGFGIGGKNERADVLNQVRTILRGRRSRRANRAHRDNSDNIDRLSYREQLHEGNKALKRRWRDQWKQAANSYHTAHPGWSPKYLLFLARSIAPRLFGARAPKLTRLFGDAEQLRSWSREFGPDHDLAREPGWETHAADVERVLTFYYRDALRREYWRLSQQKIRSVLMGSFQLVTGFGMRPVRTLKITGIIVGLFADLHIWDDTIASHCYIVPQTLLGVGRAFFHFVKVSAFGITNVGNVGAAQAGCGPNSGQFYAIEAFTGYFLLAVLVAFLVEAVFARGE